MKNALISDLVALPDILRDQPALSWTEVLKEMGYPKHRNEITFDLIRCELVSKPERVDSWLSWSADKRTDSGWYFVKRADHLYSVGYYPSGHSEQTFTDKFDACATFIKKELEETAAAKV